MSNIPGRTLPYPPGKHTVPAGIITNQTVGYESAAKDWEKIQEQEGTPRDAQPWPN